MYLNKTQIIGNLTRDPEMKALPSGVNVANFSIATNRSFKDKDGNKQEEVEFHNVVAFGKQAEVINQYCSKGKQLYVEGRLKTSSWEKDGAKHYKTEIVLENFQFGNNKETTQSSPAVEKSEGVDNVEEEIKPEDIPFN